MIFKKKNPIKLRTIFMGTSSFSAKILENLLEEKYKIISVYTQPDKKSGRDQSMKSSSVKLLAKENNLSVKEITKFDQTAINDLKEQKPDLIIVVAYGKILPKEVLETPGFGAINIHTSLLPKYRGPSPVHNAILNGEKETGVTLILMDEGIDSGDIISQKKVTIDPEEILPDVIEKLANASQELIAETLPAWVKRKIDPKKQNETEATFCQLIERSDGKIFWNEKAQDIFNKFRAFQPWPGVFSFWENNSKLIRIKLNLISFTSDESEFESEPCGKVLKKDNQFLVKANQGLIILKEIQAEGKNNVPIENFVNGYPEFLGSILK